MGNVKNFGQFINEDYFPDKGFAIGDLIWAKDMGQAGLAGLVVSAKYKDEDGDDVQDVLFRGYNGEVHPMSLEHDSIEDGIDHLPEMDRKSDISAYQSIATKRGIVLNPKYQETIEDNVDNESFEPKTFSVQYNVGKAKYLVSYHDGAKKHKDNSPFFDIEICANKKELDSFTSALKADGYTEK